MSINKTTNSEWPILDYNKDDVPHFLFIITPPFSGSTALSELINTSAKTMTLHEKGEGQWLIPALSKIDRWDEEKKINYESIKSVWLNKYQETNRLVQNIEIIIEKSPPNMIRLDSLISTFKSHSFLANNRNPYAHCASRLFRNYRPNKITESDRLVILEGFAHDWLVRSKRIKNLINKHSMPLLTYEEFCQKPSLVIEKLHNVSNFTDTIKHESKVKVKDYPAQTISNQNSRQISKLNSNEIAILTSIFSDNEALLGFYGYHII